MLKYYSFLFILFFEVLSAQNLKIKIVDSENLKAINNARVLVGNKVFYTNDDGFAIVPERIEGGEVSAPNFQTQKFEKPGSEIRLKPVYKLIDEVKIVSVDIREIFENVLKDYGKIYYDKPSIYDVVYKQKNFYDNTLAFLVIADAKLWTKTNQYNFKYGLKKEYDEILQMQLNTIKYLKTTNKDTLLTGRTNEFSHEIIGNFFFNYELSRLIGILKSDNNKNFGTLIYQEGSFQMISFKIKKLDGTNISGEFTYDTLNKAISRFKISYDQTEFPILKKKSVDGRAFDYKMGIASMIFDFYLKDGKYIPSQYNFEGDNFLIIIDGQKHLKKFSRQITYNTFNPSNGDQLNPRIDFTKDFWENVPNNEQKPSTVILSEEEANFLNISGNEK
ncbi:hypothetical protein CEY12_13365 [Chryseobacterium sp. T16E-39]|uniref:hypothetical protein n=1 Tax=Chryseobacterium sp. T16E-39 TaxID=2015076 RepID=UPI000B5B1312|nr:hypothetical protein [Chryseobacterium sp. T16E-39]ASK31034.1 hypothetical protein CEY12_13365 [Chryseobacterium sp. T16E-39]